MGIRVPPGKHVGLSADQLRVLFTECRDALRNGQFMRVCDVSGGHEASAGLSR
ncbi:MAG: hypothetical protein ACRDQ7_04450 [Haloechinothrix sp.]